MGPRLFEQLQIAMAYIVSGAIGFALGIKLGVLGVIWLNFPSIF